MDANRLFISFFYCFVFTVFPAKSIQRSSINVKKIQHSDKKSFDGPVINSLSHKKKTIAVLGAGPSGLVAAKYLLKEGYHPLVLEKNKEIGGVWNPKTGSVWESMRTNLSKYTCSFSGFPWPEKTLMFPSSKNMFDYLYKYAVDSGVISYIQFGSEVIHLTYSKDSKSWKIVWENHGCIKEKNVDCVIVATGIFSKAYIPNIQGMHTFPGSIVHSKDYKHANLFKDKKVLVVGGSLSAVEIAADLSSYAKVTHNFRESFWVLERYITEFSSGYKLPIDLVFYNRKFYATDLYPMQGKVYVKKNSYMEKLCCKQQKIPAIRVNKNNFNLPINITISDDYVTNIKSGRIFTKKCDIIRFEGNSVFFSDGSVESYDSIIMATGFKVDISYMDKIIQDKIEYNSEDLIQPIILYKETVRPELPNMFFIGMYKGPYFAVIEHQAKWASKVFSGKLTLPSIDKMIHGLHEERNIRHMIPKMQFPHPDYVKFADDIAKLSGKNLNFEELKQYKDSSIYESFLDMSVIPGFFSIKNAPKKIKKMRNIIIKSRLKNVYSNSSNEE